MDVDGRGFLRADRHAALGFPLFGDDGVVTGVGFLIHLYATGYMWKDHEEPRGYSRFFAYMNLFVFAMLMLVLGDNLLVFFLGWEGVGLCSYLLIGFYHRDGANGYAARKAFVVTRVGDTALALGLFLLFWKWARCTSKTRWIKRRHWTRPRSRSSVCCCSAAR